MKLVTWNVNSIRARADYLALFLDAVAPDVLCLQELKTTADTLPDEVFSSRGYQVAAFGQPRWNGVLIASRTPIEDVHTGLDPADEGEARLIAATVGGVRLVNLYCPQGQSADSDKFEYKLRFYQALRAWVAETSTPQSPLILTGDFNIAPRPQDVYDPVLFAGVPSFHPLEHAEWRALLDLGLHDALLPGIKPKTFTFWDYRGAAFRFNQGLRIDHFLLTAPLMERLVSTTVHRDWRKKKDGLTPSDHAPVELVLRDEA